MTGAGSLVGRSGGGGGGRGVRLFIIKLISFAHIGFFSSCVCAFAVMLGDLGWGGNFGRVGVGWG